MRAGLVIFVLCLALMGSIMLLASSVFAADLRGVADQLFHLVAYAFLLQHVVGAEDERRARVRRERRPT